MITTVEELVVLLKKKPVAGLGSRILLDLGEDKILLDGENGQVVIGDHPADCTIAMNFEDMSSIIAGRMDPNAAFMMGKIQVEGDLSVAMKLQSLLT